MNNRKKIFYGIGILSALLLIYFLYRIRKPLLELLSPVFFALLLTYLLNPLVNIFEQKKIPRILGILIIYIFVIAGIAVMMFYFIPQLLRSITELTQTIPEFFETYESLLNEFVIQYRYSDLPSRIIEILDENIYEIEQALMNALQQAVGAITGIFTFLFDFVLGAVIAFYMLKDKEKFKEVLISLVPRKGREWVLALARDIDVVLSGFVRGQLLVALLLSILTVIGLWVLGIKYALILGMIAGLANIIPYFGPILGSIPAVIFAFIQSPIKALWVIVLYVTFQQLESAILSPKIVGSRVGLHPVITIVVVLAGGKFFGLIGLLLSVPVAGILKVLGSRVVKSIV